MSTKRMTFGDVLYHLALSRSLRREVWPSTKYIYCPEAREVKLHKQERTPLIYLRKSAGTAPWIPNHTDLFARDWVLAPKE